ncbi:PREDICTED: 28S ribosomal protein S17, mitochondrial [Dufourea novaeangliae]|uniref:28S ribosomal protein S17, mitochondrial n=1 Tax=Dufourea novaeangliae TaxID=178035 RepID=A0A154PG48_DUFNO|nr:PREDICTED: 28S ribosomal protein S17, mitochondrial [Dufourea novaeangliae]KZC10843.1 28S ribosomal protein S17, mitochondrial [Dufourea novaeangliae]
MAQKKLVKQTLTYLLGVSVPTSKQNAAKIRIRRLEFDNHLKMHFPSYEFVYALDSEKRCKTGDTVLIQNLPEKITRLISHKVIDVIYPLGDIKDPISGKKCVVGKYRDTINEDAELFGKLKNAFDYDEATPRGSTEGVRDFSNKKTYVKYNDDSKNSDPYAVDPS